MKKLHRDYCYFLDSTKYNRNWGCKAHDNAYGVKGGGGEADRWAADRALYRHMRGEGDPAAPIAYAAVLCWGWLYFNYHPGRWLWHGQLLRRVGLMR